ncbi:Hsp33 family molecular chaperone HslO [Sphingorhabdus arenilitoris]|uniref:Hsp33 family molecular chaperone HslO n=1 Tax=Sphingorhabdus arenilitoris TaxID=1490041 RepID=A0ABV8RJ02_9SPHN
MAEQSETLSDLPLAFSIPARHARGRIVRLDGVLNEILSAHKYPPLIEKTLAEALVLAALLGSAIKDDEGQLTIQAQTEEGAIDLLVCDYKDGALRGYVKHDPEKLAVLPANATLFGLFGKGYLAITFDRKVPEEKGSGRYQGIVPLEGDSLCSAAEHYFVQSEQIPTLIRVAIDHVDGPDGPRTVAGGIMLQHLADGEEGRERLHVRLDHPEWEHVSILAGSIKPQELTDSALPLEEIVWRLFHEEDQVRISTASRISKGCRCDPVHIRDVIARFAADERTEMAEDDGNITVNCEFCSRQFPISLASFDN